MKPSERIKEIAKDNDWRTDSLVRDYPRDLSAHVAELTTRLDAVAAYLDERETQLHPIARAHPGKHRQVIAHPAPPSSPGGGILLQLDEARDNAAEWASRYASLAEAAYPVLAWLPRNDPGARMVAERLTGVLEGRGDRCQTESAHLKEEAVSQRRAAENARGEVKQLRSELADVCHARDVYRDCLKTATDDCEMRAREQTDAQAELTRLKEENARLSGDLVALSKGEAIQTQLAATVYTKIGEAAVALQKELADEKAAHEVTRRELRKRHAVVEAARQFMTCQRGKDGMAAISKLDEALSALDQPTQAEPATPPGLPVPVEAPREIRVGSKWRIRDNDFVAGDDVVVTGFDERGWIAVSADGERPSLWNPAFWHEECEWVSDPEPPAERPVVGEGEL